MSSTLTVHSFAVETRHATSLQFPCGCASLFASQSSETRVVVSVYPPPPFLRRFKAVLALFDLQTCPDGFYALKRKMCGFFEKRAYLDYSAVYTDNLTVYTDNFTVRTNNPAVRTDNPTVYTDNSTVRTDNTTVYTDNSTVNTNNPTVRTDNPAVHTDNLKMYKSPIKITIILKL